MDISKFLPSLPLPEWISIPIIIIAVVVTLWPKLVSMARELSASSRIYTREKQRLELLKLRYEIEAIKKENKLSDLDEDILYPRPDIPPLESPSEEVAAPREFISFWWRFVYGAAGSVAPILINFLLMDLGNIVNFGVFSLAGYLIRIFILVTLAGISSAVLAKGNATRQVSFLIGLSISLLLSLILTGMAQVPQVPREMPSVS